MNEKKKESAASADEVKAASEVAKPVEKVEESVYVFKSSGKHGEQPFTKGQPVKASKSQMDSWLVNGVIITKKEYDALMLTSKVFAGKK